MRENFLSVHVELKHLIDEVLILCILVVPFVFVFYGLSLDKCSNMICALKELANLH